MTATVVQNYTDEQTTTVVTSYKAGMAVEMIAEMVGKSVRSVVAKLSKEGVYVSKTKVTAGTRVTKSMLVAQIAAKTGATETQLESLEKATRDALELVAKALA